MKHFKGCRCFDKKHYNDLCREAYAEYLEEIKRKLLDFLECDEDDLKEMLEKILPQHQHDYS